MLEGLLFWMGVLQAEEQLAAAAVVELPYLKEAERRRTVRRWQRAAQPTVARELPTVEEVDPDKARVWFMARGVKLSG